MGQAQSESAAATTADSQTRSGDSAENSTSSSSSTSMESLLAEAVAYGSDGNETLDAKAQKALECPCIADLRNGPCGDQFSKAFLCFLKSTAAEKGSDCVHPFVTLQNCIKVNPDAFSDDVLEQDEGVGKENEPAQDYKIIPPDFAEEPRSPNSKL